MILLIDKYDSFSYNLYQLIGQVNRDIEVYRNDKITADEIKDLNPEAIILSPGPSNPSNAGITMDIIKKYHKEKAILGVCLGYQAIAEFFGANIVEAKEPVHGKCSEIYFEQNEPLFKGFEQGFSATRYHSLVVENIKPPIIPIANTKDNILMGIKIKNLPIYGVQFHPEAILTKNGINIFKNFIDICGIL